MWTGFFNDAACYSSHHFTSSNTPWRRMLNVMIADKGHIISVWWSSSNNSSSTGNYIPCTCIDKWISCSSNKTLWPSRNIIFILILARDLLWSLMTALSGTHTRLRWELFIHKLCDSIWSYKADALLAALSVDHAHIDTWWPIIITLSLRRLALAVSLLLEDLLTVLHSIFRGEPIVVIDFILILLHIIPSPGVNTLLINLIRIVASVSLLLSSCLLSSKHAS